MACFGMWNALSGIPGFRVLYGVGAITKPRLSEESQKSLSRRKQSKTLIDGRNLAIVIAEALARVIAAIRIASVRWRSHLPPKQRN